MSRFGWAYVDCEPMGSAAGPTGSVQFLTGAGFTSGTKFGNTNDDVHHRTGSLIVKNVAGTSLLNVDNSTETTTVRGLNVLYTEVTNTKITASVPSYILGVSRTGSVEINIPNASTYGAGAMLVVKDEVADRGGSHILLSASAGYSIDGSDTYILTGSMPSISLYSNGSNWFIF